MSHLPVPPHDTDAERALLGGILRDPDVLPDVLAIARPESMYTDGHRKIFAALADIAGRGTPVDLVALYDLLRKNKHLEDVGGKDYLAELWAAIPTGANATYHAKLVRETALRRGMIRAANELLRDAFDPAGTADDLLAETGRKFDALGADATTGQEPRRVGEVARARLDLLDERIASGATLSGLSTGFADLDRVLGGLRGGELIVVGARPSLGKTAFSLNVAERVAADGNAVLFFSLEMPAGEITDRLIAMQSGVPMHRMARPRDLQSNHIDAIFHAVTDDSPGLSAMPLFIDDTSDQSAARVAAVSRRACRRHGVKLLVIDYLQLMRAENLKDNRAQQVGTLALRVKNLARAPDVPVILLSQLNRDLEHANRRPRLSDLKESGDTEQHADRVLLLHREQNLPADDPIWPIEVIVAKNRNGPTADVRLAYRRPVLRFENVAVGVSAHSA